MATYGGSKHDWSRKKHSDENEEEEDDPVDSMIKKTGCLELHYKVQECMADHRDWRKCQSAVSDFKTCVNNYHQGKMKK